jgi:hypothetical protein
MALFLINKSHKQSILSQFILQHTALQSFILKHLYPGGCRTRIFCLSGGCDGRCDTPPCQGSAKIFMITTDSVQTYGEMRQIKQQN